MNRAADHPLLGVLLDAAEGRFPDVDGAVTWLPPLGSRLEAVVAMTGHAFIASRLSSSDFADLPVPPDGFGAAYHPGVLQRIAGEDGSIGVGVIDATLVVRGGSSRGARPLPERSDRDDHPRVRHALGLRADVTVYGDERGLVTLGSGLAGRLELSVEAEPAGQGRGWGRSLLLDGLATVPEGDWVFAAVSPGNARSLRAFLALGFVPIGSEVQILLS